jgi:hypothetical protein
MALLSKSYMSTVSEIKQAMKKLPLGKRLALVKWAVKEANDNWDKQMTPRKPQPRASSTRFRRLDLKDNGTFQAGFGAPAPAGPDSRVSEIRDLEQRPASSITSL